MNKIQVLFLAVVNIFTAYLFSGFRMRNRYEQQKSKKPVYRIYDSTSAIWATYWKAVNKHEKKMLKVIKNKLLHVINLSNVYSM